MRNKERYILGSFITAVMAVVLFCGVPSLFAGDAGAGVKTGSEGGTLTVTVYDYANNKAVSGDSPKIKWSSVDISKSPKWVIGDYCLKIEHTASKKDWGIQVYTDNKNNTSVKDYNGLRNPAGLVGQTTTAQALPMAWLATTSLDTPPVPVERLDGTGFVSGQWHWLKDKNTKDDEYTKDVDEEFESGGDYETFWNQKGVAIGDAVRAGSPSVVYLFLAADFSSATAQKYQTDSLTIEQFIDSAQDIFPFYIYKDGAPAVQMANEYISGMMDKHFSGNELRLIESYSDSDSIAFIYDNALAMSALLARPTKDNLRRAKILCKTLIWAQDNDKKDDGRIRKSYDSSKEFDGSAPPYADESCNTGDMAWAICALMQYYKNSDDTDDDFLDDVLAAAAAAGDFIDSKFKDSGTGKYGYYYGYDKSDTLDKAKSTEHNIAAYVAFAHLLDATSASKWGTRASHAKDFIEKVAWYSSQDRYLCGVDSSGKTDKTQIIADVNLLNALALINKDRIKKPIEYVKSKLLYSDTVYNLKGIDFGFDTDDSSAKPDGIWFEGTAQFAAAYKVAGYYGKLTDASATYLDSIKLAQGIDLDANDSGGDGDYEPDGRAIPAASVSKGINTGLGGTYKLVGHVGATAWFACVMLDYNPLWGTSLEDAVPTISSGKVSDNDSFDVDEDDDSLKDKTDHLGNHYVPAVYEWTDGLVTIDGRCTDNPYKGDTCFKFNWNGKNNKKSQKWTGLVWQEPAGEWTGGTGKGYDLRGVSRLSFYIRTDSASMKDSADLKVKVKFGYSNDSCYTTELWKGAITTTWTNYTITVPTGADSMLHMSNGFQIIVDDAHTPKDSGCSIYLDEIRFEK